MIVSLASLIHIRKILDSNFSPESGVPVSVIPSAIMSQIRPQAHPTLFRFIMRPTVQCYILQIKKSDFNLLKPNDIYIYIYVVPQR